MDYEHTGTSTKIPINKEKGQQERKRLPINKKMKINFEKIKATKECFENNKTKWNCSDYLW